MVSSYLSYPDSFDAYAFIITPFNLVALSQNRLPQDSLSIEERGIAIMG
jgi:hypothetical protein